MSFNHRMIQHDTHSYILNTLGSRIATGEIEAGTILTLTALEEEYQVSRTVIREVVRVLESHGMLISRRRVGITVQPITAWDILDASIIQWRLSGPSREQQLLELMELRYAIEPVAASFAAERANDEQRDRILALAQTLQTLGHQGHANDPEFLEADLALHSLMLEASSSPLLVRMVGPISEVITGRARLNLLSGDPEPGTLEGHLAMAVAVHSGDPDAAATASAHLLHIIASEIRHHD